MTGRSGRPAGLRVGRGGRLAPLPSVIFPPPFGQWPTFLSTATGAELGLRSPVVVAMRGNETALLDKPAAAAAGDEAGDAARTFTFDYSFWSVNAADAHFASAAGAARARGACLLRGQPWEAAGGLDAAGAAGRGMAPGGCFAACLFF